MFEIGVEVWKNKKFQKLNERKSKQAHVLHINERQGTDYTQNNLIKGHNSRKIFMQTAHLYICL